MVIVNPYEEMTGISQRKESTQPPPWELQQTRASASHQFNFIVAVLDEDAPHVELTLEQGTATPLATLVISTPVALEVLAVLEGGEESGRTSSAPEEPTTLTLDGGTSN